MGGKVVWEKWQQPMFQAFQAFALKTISLQIDNSLFFDSIYLYNVFNWNFNSMCEA